MFFVNFVILATILLTLSTKSNAFVVKSSITRKNAFISMSTEDTTIKLATETTQKSVTASTKKVSNVKTDAKVYEKNRVAETVKAPLERYIEKKPTYLKQTGFAKAEKTLTEAKSAQFEAEVSAKVARKKTAAPVKALPAAAEKAVSVGSPVVSTPITSKPAAQVLVPPPSAGSLSGSEFAAGVAAGLSPFVIIPLILASTLGGILKKPKPLPSSDPSAPKATLRGGKAVKAYSKPLNIGAQEGIDELLQGRADAGSKAAIKLSLAGFGSAAAGLAVLLALNGQKPETKEVPKAAPAAKVAQTPKPVEIKVEAPKPVEKKVEAPKPVEIKVEAPKPVEKKVEAPKPVEIKVEAPKPVEIKVESPKPVEKKVEAPKPVEKKVEAPKPVEKKVEAPKPDEKKVEAPKPVEKKVEAPKPDEKKIEALKPVVPKGMEPEQVDLEKLKLLRKVKK